MSRNFNIHNNNFNVKNLLEKIKESSTIVRTKKIEILHSDEKDISLNVDKSLNAIIAAYLKNEYPYPILSEEARAKKSYESFSGVYWILDPLDGSYNYSRQLPLSCISLALWENTNPVMGIIYDFHRDGMYVGVVDNQLGIVPGAWKNEEAVHVSRVMRRCDAVLSTGFPSWRDFGDQALSSFISHIQEWKKIRLLGSAALSLAWVASGIFDAYIEEDIRIWDVAAGLAIVKAAGGAIRIESRNRDNFITASATNGFLEI